MVDNLDPQKEQEARQKYNEIIYNTEAKVVERLGKKAEDDRWEVAERHGLRGFNAIHLASALTLKIRLGSTITFSSSDYKLEDAAKLESLDVAKRK